MVLVAGWLIGMTQIEVRPEAIGLCALKIQDAGETWGQEGVAMSTDADDVPSLLGTDELGAVLTDIYQPAGPDCFAFTREAGFCLVETGEVLGFVAAAYTEVEQDNAARAAEVAAELDRLGP